MFQKARRYRKVGVLKDSWAHCDWFCLSARLRNPRSLISKPGEVRW